LGQNPTTRQLLVRIIRRKRPGPFVKSDRRTGHWEIQRDLYLYPGERFIYPLSRTQKYTDPQTHRTSQTPVDSRRHTHACIHKNTLEGLPAIVNDTALTHNPPPPLNAINEGSTTKIHPPTHTDNHTDTYSNTHRPSHRHTHTDNHKHTYLHTQTTSNDPTRPWHKGHEVPTISRLPKNISLFCKRTL